MEQQVSLEQLLGSMAEKNASDLHISAGSYPFMRIDGALTPVGDVILTPEVVQGMLETILKGRQKAEFLGRKELDFSYTLPDVARFRVNYYQEKESWAGAFRIIPARPFTIDELKLPLILKDFAMKPRGLILVTGPTGCGKSTTLAAMIEHINEHKRVHIITVEDPVEFTFRNKKSVICQREVGQDTFSFSNALRHVLRQDPDVILIGEMRDLESTTIALQAAETGHLVLATLHTNNAPATIERVVDIFPSIQQQQIRTLLAITLEGVICQTLLPKAKEPGRVLASEIMLVNQAVRNIIREGRTHQLANVIQSGAKEGMQALDICLRDLYKKGLITYEEAFSKAINPQEFLRLIESV